MATRKVWIKSLVAGGVTLPDGVTITPDDLPVEQVMSNQLLILSDRKMIKIMKTKKQNYTIKSDYRENRSTEEGSLEIHIASRES